VILIYQGAFDAAREDVFRYGPALATDTLPDPQAPAAWIRWLTGNADPSGRLPWPFGKTHHLVWWGSGSWPLWLASVPSIAHLLGNKSTTGPRRLVAIWTLAAWAEVILPGLYWQHYYMLPIAGVAIAVAICLADEAAIVGRMLERASSTRSGESAVAKSAGRLVLAAAACVLLAGAIGMTLVIQIHAYLLTAPAELTIQYKGGGQWVALRDLGGEIKRRAAIWDRPRLYVWGWQSPLHFYSGLDAPTRHFFVDNLLRDQADRHHPLIEPRTEEIVATLRRRPPELIFIGYSPFRALRVLLEEDYVPSGLVHVPPRTSLGLWVRRDSFARFESRAVETEHAR
jgi:hypothetical protein